VLQRQSESYPEGVNMASRMSAFLLLIAVSSSGALSADFTDDAWKQRPVSKVINLLKDMQQELEKEQDADEDLYDAMTCWCEANDKAKTKAIADAEQRTSDLTSAIEMYTAKHEQLTTDISELKRQIAENTAGLASASALREKEGSEFHENEKDSIQAIGNLKAAVVSLQKHHGEALTQEAMVQLRQVLQKPLFNGRRPDLLRQLGLAPAHQRIIASFLQGSGEYVRDQGAQSGAIFGILKQMKESFETNLEKSQLDEKGAQGSFSDMKTAKGEEINAGNAGVNSKTTELADADEKNAQSKEDLADTAAQLDADRTFLADVKARCAAMDQEFAERSKVRNEETTAVSEALEILTEDDARDLMSRSTLFFQTSLQLSSTRDAATRAKAASILSKAARRLGSPQLSALAVTMKSDVFGKIKDSIDLMIEQLKKEMKDEVEKKDWCRDELHKNEMALTAKYEDKEDVEAKIASHEALISKLKEEIGNAEAEIKQTNIEIKQASENRVKSNKGFQETVLDQRATQQVLAKAMDKLKGFYSKKASLLQNGRRQSPLVGAPPPGEFQPYKKKGGAGGIMGLMQNIINESKHVEGEARSAEQEQQEAYEQFVSDAGAAIKSLQAEITDKTGRVASADADLVRSKEDLMAVAGELEDLNQYSKETHSDCHYILHNFETRQAARTDEVEALDQAKSVLSGASV